MSLLLDTHALLWWLSDDDRLSVSTRASIRDPERLVYVSAVTVWEIAIKRTLGKLEAPGDLLDAIGESGFSTLAISMKHAWAAGQLSRCHGDPFDRMLIAQAMHENLTLVTADDRILQYDVATLRA